MRLCLCCMSHYSDNMNECPKCGYSENESGVLAGVLAPGTVVNEKYVVGVVIYQNDDYISYICWDKLLERRLLLKEYYPSNHVLRAGDGIRVQYTAGKTSDFESRIKSFLEQAKMLVRFNGVESIVHTYDSFEENGTAYVTMEYLEGETLESYLSHTKSMSEESAMEFLKPAADAVEALHQQQIIHGNIAPEHLFLTVGASGRLLVKLIGFGGSYLGQNGRKNGTTAKTNKGYSAEEMYRTDGSIGVYTDVYALSAIMYRMVTGSVPIDAVRRKSMLDSKKADPLIEPGKYNHRLSENAEIAILNALNVRAVDRTPTVGQFMEELVSTAPVERRSVSRQKVDFSRWPLWAKVGVPLGILAACVAVYISFNTSFTKPTDTYEMPEDSIRVPDFYMVNYEEAEKQAEEQGLRLVISEEVFMYNTEEGLILSQSKESGTVIDKERTIFVTTSTAREEYLIPDFTGRSISTAVSIAEAMGLEVETVVGEEKGYHEGCVISQSLAPFSTVKTKEHLVLTVSGETVTGKKKAPDLVGKTLEEALEEAKKAGVVLRVMEKEYGDDYEDNVVLEQSIAPGENVKANNSVKLTVSMKTRQFKMPNLLQRSQYISEKILYGMGIVPTIEQKRSDVVLLDGVIEQDIEAGETIVPGQALRLIVSTGGKQFDMIDVVDQTQEAAVEKLEALGLKVKIEKDYDSKIDVGSVISQSVVGGKRVVKNTEVTLLICSTEGYTKVKSILGMKKQEAKDKMHEQGFLIHYDSEYSDTVPEGKVISQSPEEGTYIKDGSVISCVLSKGIDPATIETEPETTKAYKNPGYSNNSSYDYDWDDDDWDDDDWDDDDWDDDDWDDDWDDDDWDDDDWDDDGWDDDDWDDDDWD